MEPRDFKEALNKAKRALHKYYRENHLDPAKDYSKDPIHGDMVTNLILRLNKERDKLERKFPIIKIKSNLKLVRTMAKNIKEAKASKKEKKVKATVTEVETNKSKKEEKEPKAKKEKKESTKRPSKYDYPLIDGREMNSIEKKKYRMEQRKLKAKEGKEESKEPKPTSKKVKKEETSKKVKKEKTSKDVKKKKVKKEED